LNEKLSDSRDSKEGKNCHLLIVYLNRFVATLNMVCLSRAANVSHGKVHLVIAVNVEHHLGTRKDWLAFGVPTR